MNNRTHSLHLTPLRRGFFCDERRTAAHEAGHALAAHLLGQQIHRAFVGTDPAGEVQEEGAEGGIAITLTGDWRHALFVGVAGWAAEEACFPGAPAERGTDLAFCTALLLEAKFSPAQAGQIIDQAAQAVHGQLQAKQAMLEAIADYLQRFREIDGEAISALALEFVTVTSPKP